MVGDIVDSVVEIVVDSVVEIVVDFVVVGSVVVGIDVDSVGEVVGSVLLSVDNTDWVVVGQVHPLALVVAAEVVIPLVVVTVLISGVVAVLVDVLPVDSSDPAGARCITLLPPAACDPVAASSEEPSASFCSHASHFAVVVSAELEAAVVDSAGEVVASEEAGGVVLLTGADEEGAGVLPTSGQTHSVVVGIFEVVEGGVELSWGIV